MDFLRWSCQDVALWVESIGFPQYKACFTDNHITGRKLIHVHCSSLTRLGVRDFQHMKTLSAHVRDLLGVSEPPWSRSITEPLDGRTLFLTLKSRSGQQSDGLTYQHQSP